MSATPIGVGVIGLGFMGRTHVAAYQAAAAAGFPCRLVAVCDPKPSRLTGELEANGNLATGSGRLFDPKSVRGTTRAEDLIAAADVHLISICTPTDSHVRLATSALAAGKHVLVEKPVSLDAAEVRALARLADSVGRHCMPAMCMRFWPGWDFLHEAVRNTTFGKVQSATFQRLGTAPGWGGGFYSDVTRSGGALFDLHIHDTDFVVWCFGKPDSVHTAGSLQHMTTSYRFARGPALVTAEGAWDLTPSAGFRMKFLVTFEHATLDFDLARDPHLLLHGKLRSEPVPLAKTLGYDGQVRELVRAIADGRTELRASLREAATVLDVLADERRSLGV